MTFSRKTCSAVFWAS